MDKITLLRNLAGPEAGFCRCELRVDVGNADTFELAYRWVQALRDCYKCDPYFLPSIRKIDLAYEEKSPELMAEGLQSLCIDIIHC